MPDEWYNYVMDSDHTSKFGRNTELNNEWKLLAQLATIKRNYEANNDKPYINMDRDLDALDEICKDDLSMEMFSDTNSNTATNSFIIQAIMLSKHYHALTAIEDSQSDILNQSPMTKEEISQYKKEILDQEIKLSNLEEQHAHPNNYTTRQTGMILLGKINGFFNKVKDIFTVKENSTEKKTVNNVKKHPAPKNDELKKAAR